MLKFQPDARVYLTEIRALSTDQNDNDVFVGLTSDESVWYANYLDQSFHGTIDRTDGSQERYFRLQDKHEAARRSVLAAESLMCNLSRE